MNPFSELIGQRQAVELLTSALKKNRIAPAYLFAGPPGVGRRLAATEFSALLLAHEASSQPYPSILKRVRTGNHPDLLWVRPTYSHQGNLISASEAAAAGIKRKAPPQIRIEQIRQITEFLSRPPLEASRAVVAIEDAQLMTEAAANALLKTLEEPGRATLILIAASAQALLPTLVSRCQRIPFFSLAQAEMEQVLRQTGHGEILEHPAVVAIAQGSPGQAILSFTQLQAIPGELLDPLNRFPQITPTQQSPLERIYHALKLAAAIAHNLDTEVQLWLIDYLQQSYWQQYQAGTVTHPFLSQLETARKALLSYAQPRLVWEVTLLGVEP